MAPCLGFFKVRNPLKQASSVQLVQDTPGWISEHMDSSVTHICSNTTDDTISSSSVAGGPNPGMVISGQEQDIRTSGCLPSAGTGHQNVRTKTGPTPIQDKPKFGNFEDLNGF